MPNSATEREARILLFCIFGEKVKKLHKNYWDNAITAGATTFIIDANCQLAQPLLETCECAFTSALHRLFGTQLVLSITSSVCTWCRDELKSPEQIWGHLSMCVLIYRVSQLLVQQKEKLEVLSQPDTRLEAPRTTSAEQPSLCFPTLPRKTLWFSNEHVA